MNVTSVDDTAAPLPRVGEFLDERFEIRALLGEGGMGHVFRALDRRLGREVALKLIVPRYLGRPEREQRFLRELELGQRAARDPHLVEVVDGGRLRTGWPFLVMELVEGRALANRLALGPLRVHVAARMARQVAGAIRTLHRSGVVHRDITPANVITLRNDAVLIDLSHAGDAAAPRLPLGHPGRLTRDNEVPGSHHYMPPEQARAEPAQPAMDVYAFGVTLADMLTGLTAENFSREVFIELQREGKVEPPRIDIRIHTHVPRALAELVEACTALDPGSRPTMDEIVARLDDALATLGMPADSSGPGMPASRIVVEPARITEPMRDHARVTTSLSPPPPLDSEETPPGGSPLLRDGYDAPQGARIFVTALVVTITVLALGALAWWWWSTRAIPVDGGKELPNGSEAETDTAPPATRSQAPIAPDAEPPGTPGAATSDRPPLPVTGDGAVEVPPPDEPTPGPTVDEPGAAGGKDKAKRKNKAKPPRPSGTDGSSPAESEECIALRDDVEQATEQAAWAKVAKLTRRRECWSSQADRKRLRVRALFESQAWSDCVEEGRGISESQVKQWVDLCQRHVD